VKRLQIVNPGTLSTIAWGALIVALFAGLLLMIYKSKLAVRPAEYEGRIVEKWAGYEHSIEGSFPYFRLLVETDNGRKLTVAVNKENYERARVGMRIKKTRKGIELTRIESQPLFAHESWQHKMRF
jgi:hypothetical protein